MLITRFAVQGVDIQTLDWHNKTFFMLSFEKHENKFFCFSDTHKDIDEIRSTLSNLKNFMTFT